MTNPQNYTPGWKSYLVTGNVSDIVPSTSVATAIGTKVDASSGQVDPNLALVGENSGYSTLQSALAALYGMVASVASLLTKTSNISIDGTIFNGKVTGATSGDVSNATTGVTGASNVATTASLAVAAVSGTYGYAATSTVDHMGVGLHYRGDINAGWLIYSADTGSSGTTESTAGVALALQDNVVPKNSVSAPTQLTSASTLADVISYLQADRSALQSAGVYTDD